jgi:hypothetical protein
MQHELQRAKDDTSETLKSKQKLQHRIRQLEEETPSKIKHLEESFSEKMLHMENKIQSQVAALSRVMNCWCNESIDFLGETPCRKTRSTSETTSCRKSFVLICLGYVTPITRAQNVQAAEQVEREQKSKAEAIEPTSDSLSQLVVALQQQNENLLKQVEILQLAPPPVLLLATPGG